jgi:hypothetical protein
VYGLSAFELALAAEITKIQDFRKALNKQDL